MVYGTKLTRRLEVRVGVAGDVAMWWLELSVTIHGAKARRYDFVALSFGVVNHGVKLRIWQLW